MTNTTWHRNVGADITADMTAKEQLQAAGLDWTVETSPIRYGQAYEYKGKDYRRAVYRSDNGLLLDT